MEIILEDIDKLIPYARNPRKNQAIDKVAASIREFGFRQPIVVDKEMVIIAGHTRYEGAKKLGMKQVPIHIAEELTPAQVRAYRIADNRVAQDSEWDIGLLNTEFTDLLDVNFDLELLGFDPKELEDLIVDKPEGLTDDDFVPDIPEKPKSKLGEIYQLGHHRLMCGDSTNGGDVALLMNGEKADSCITSPPYNQGGGTFGGWFSCGKRGESLYQNDCDNKTKEEYFEFCISIFSNILSILNDVHSLVWNVSYNAKSRDDYGKIIFSDKNPFNVKETIIWNKGGSINLPQKGIYSRKCELVFIMSNYDGYLTSQEYGDCRWNLYETTKINQLENHKATFSVEFADMCIDDFTLEKNIIYDPFLGTGTTLIASEKKNRKCYGMELDPIYVDVIIKRWEQWTGEKAELVKQ